MSVSESLSALSKKDLSTLDHLAIVVTDLEKTVHWYRTSFGCEIVYEEKGMVVLQFANVKLALLLPSHEQPHLAIKRADATSFGLVHKNLDGTRSIFVSDPSGNLVELIQEE